MNPSPDQETQPQQSITTSSPDMKGFEVDDMVWGKVKSHPWWPGQIFNESFAAGASVRGRKPGAVLVAFYGDSSYGWFDPSELVPFAPNFKEMSTQSTSKSFLNAISEASDEASRRGALAVVCNCRNSSKFEPAGVANYVFAEIPGYAERAVYSLNQIEISRQLFDPVNSLNFIKSMAVSPLNASEVYNDDLVLFMKMRAMMTAYRSRVFEEFDKTYAEAFNVDVGPDVRRKQDKIVQRGITQRAELFSGKLKIAETLSSNDKKLKRLSSSSSSQLPIKKQKRLSSSSSSSSPKTLKPKTEPKPKAEPKPVSQPQLKSRFKSTPSKRAQNKDDDNYVLKRRDDVGPTPSSLPDLPYSSPVATQLETSIVVGPDDDKYVLQRREKKEEEAEEREKEERERKAAEREKKEKVLKRKMVGEVNSEKKKKKKKRVINFGSVNNIETEQVVFDLQQLAVDPLHGKERNAADIVRYVLLNFRSAVYQKSLVNNKAASSDKKSVKKQKRPVHKVAALPEPLEKRVKSERQEEITINKQKKVDKMKALTTEKKSALLAIKPRKEDKKKEIRAQKTEPILPSPPKVPCATALMMKFPLKTALPSIATLKAKLARFGPIDLAQTRVYWNSHMCKVTFKFKEDAKAALNHVNTNDIFGQSKVQYYIREVESTAGQDLGPDSGPQRPEPRVKFGPSEVAPTSRIKLPVNNANPPKSILKRPGEETGGASGSTSGPRVKFMLDRVNNNPDPVIVNNANKTKNVESNDKFVFATRSPPVHPVRPPVKPSLQAGEDVAVHGGPVRGFEERLIGMLVQCSDLVAMVKNKLGYLPYHPI